MNTDLILLLSFVNVMSINFAYLIQTYNLRLCVLIIILQCKYNLYTYHNYIHLQYKMPTKFIGLFKPEFGQFWEE